MKILFLSYDNRVRSQIAEGFYNYYCQHPISKSAGLSDLITQREPLDRFVLDCMAEKDINLELMTSNSTKRFYERHIKEVERVIVLCSYDELKSDDERLRWQIAHETPSDDWHIPVTNKINLKTVRDDLQKRVLELVRQTFK